MKLLPALRVLLADLDWQMREKYDRHVSVGDLLTDRWELARTLGFGDGTSCYDNVLVLGKVSVGKNCCTGKRRAHRGGELTLEGFNL